MNENKLVSVITGTYNRPRLINNCIDSVRRQTYNNIEHCIVHDGPNEIYRIWNEQGWPEAEIKRDNIPIKFVETGRQWSQFLANSVSAVPYQVAQWLSSGDYIMWLADDEEIEPDHIESLVQLIEDAKVDFVYSKTYLYFGSWMASLYRPHIIGKETPENGQITHALFRAELLDYAGFQTHVGSGTDWYQVNAWMKAGASWAFLDRVTHVHRVDKIGDGDLNKIQKPLMGW